MPRRKTPRWTLGAPALVALAVAGCGAAASRPRLHNTSEKRLLSLVARARTDASHRDGSAVHADLGRFVSDVKTLTTRGQLSTTTAGKLERQARAAAAQAAHQLHQAVATKATQARTTPTTTNPLPPAQNTPPPVQNTPPPAQNTGPPVRDAAQPAQQDNQVYGDDGSDTASSGPGHGHWHGNGHNGWSSSQGGANQSSVAKAWAKWWNSAPGGGGD